MGCGWCGAGRRSPSLPLKWSSSKASRISARAASTFAAFRFAPASATAIALACAPLAWLAWPLTRRAELPARRAPCPRRWPWRARDRVDADEPCARRRSPVATRSVTISWSCAWTFVPATLFVRRRAMVAALCAPVGALTCVLRKPESCASWLFTGRRERVGAPAAASTPTRGTGAAHRSRSRGRRSARRRRL